MAVYRTQLEVTKMRETGEEGALTEVLDPQPEEDNSGPSIGTQGQISPAAALYDFRSRTAQILDDLDAGTCDQDLDDIQSALERRLAGKEAGKDEGSSRSTLIGQIRVARKVREAMEGLLSIAKKSKRQLKKSAVYAGAIGALATGAGLAAPQAVDAYDSHQLEQESEENEITNQAALTQLLFKHGLDGNKYTKGAIRAQIEHRIHDPLARILSVEFGNSRQLFTELKKVIEGDHDLTPEQRSIALKEYRQLQTEIEDLESMLKQDKKNFHKFDLLRSLDQLQLIILEHFLIPRLDLSNHEKQPDFEEAVKELIAFVGKEKAETVIGLIFKKSFVERGAIEATVNTEAGRHLRDRHTPIIHVDAMIAMLNHYETLLQTTVSINCRTQSKYYSQPEDASFYQKVLFVDALEDLQYYDNPAFAKALLEFAKNFKGNEYGPIYAIRKRLWDIDSPRIEPVHKEIIDIFRKRGWM